MDLKNEKVIKIDLLEAVGNMMHLYELSANYKIKNL